MPSSCPLGPPRPGGSLCSTAPQPTRARQGQLTGAPPIRLWMLPSCQSCSRLATAGAVGQLRGQGTQVATAHPPAVLGRALPSSPEFPQSCPGPRVPASQTSCGGSSGRGRSQLCPGRLRRAGVPCVAGQALGGHWFRGRGSAALGQAPVSPGSGALVESWFSPGLVLGPSWFRSPRLVLCPSWYRGPGPSWFRPGSGAPVQEGLKVKAGRASGGFPTSRQPQAGSVPMAPQRLCGPLSCPVLGGDLWRGRGNSARPPPRRVTHKNPVLRAAGGGPRGGDSGPGLLGPGV